MSALSFRSITLLAIGAGVGFVAATISCQPSSTAEAGSAAVTALPATAMAAGQQGGRARLLDPTGEVSDLYAYFPGTEELGPDEIRVVACGTGMPAARRGQAAACFLVELGNGDKFLFDMGSGSMRNVMALNIPADFLRKIFLSHLHTDHWGDLDSIWAGGWTGGRTGPLEVWGPSGSREDMGTAWAIDGFMKAYNWDYVTRAVKVNSVPGSIKVHEFDFKGVNEVIYSENGVVIRSIPAIHAGDGPVSFILEWNGYKIVYGGDTAPNKWFMDHCRDSDFIIYECMLTPEQLMQFYGQPAQRAMMMQTDIHTSAQAFGKIMSTLTPRHAVAYHFFNEEATRYAIYDAVRQTYDGPLSMATDMMVWNITRGGIRERMAVSPDDAWDVAGPTPPPLPDNKFPRQESQFILDGRWQPAAEIDEKAFREFRRKHGLSN
ncbi:MAG: guanitoxin biosynthesis MBL fold metallo-hydrolase GntH [Planctomycetota bacterium]|jgi:ribonuclease Z